MSTAKAIDKRMKQAGHAKPAAILTIVSDDHNVHCLTEADLDAWWASLDPVEKADLYEEHLEQQVVAEDRAEEIPRDEFSAVAIHATGPGVAQALDQISASLSAFATFKTALANHNRPNLKGDHHAE